MEDFIVFITYKKQKSHVHCVTYKSMFGRKNVVFNKKFGRKNVIFLGSSVGKV